MNFQQYQTVRIVKLNHEAEYYDGWKFNARPLAIGDIGTLVDILKAPSMLDGYVVECSDQNGITIWLGTFSEDELADL